MLSVLVDMSASFSRRMSHALKAREQRLLRWLARFTTTYPWSVLLCCIGVAVVASFYTAHSMEFVSGRNDLISSEKRYVQLDDEYSKEFMGIDQVVVVVQPVDVQQGKEFVTRLGEQLSQDTAHIAEAFYRIDMSSLEGKKLLYLEPDDLREL